MKKDKDIYIHAKIISATDFKVYLLYTPNDIIKHPTEFELMYQILPSDDSHIRETTKFEMSNVEEPFTMDYNKSITIGIRRRAVTLEFHDIKVTCDSFGVYYLIAKNAHGFNYRRFAITDIPFGLGCKAPEEKFHVIKEHNITLADFGYNDAVNQTKIPTMFANMVDDGTVSGLGGSPVPPPEE
uniref:Uncharacterized protein n=1 Tax=Plectus sambesii TaxID=2011161 RepID=A0A914VBL6_9BILA